MKSTKEEIIFTSLRLFAERGFEAVSTSMIAAELGMTKGALYRHFKNKQAIFDATIETMFALDQKQAEQNSVPEKVYEEDEEAYKNMQFKDLAGFLIDQFGFWTENEFARLFRRMLTIEQYKTPEMNRLYQDVIGAGPVRYTADCFTEMIRKGQFNKDAEKLGAWNLAVLFFTPLQFSLQLYDGGMEKEELAKDLRLMTDEFERKYLK